MICKTEFTSYNDQSGGYSYNATLPSITIETGSVDISGTLSARSDGLYQLNYGMVSALHKQINLLTGENELRVGFIGNNLRLASDVDWDIGQFATLSQKENGREHSIKQISEIGTEMRPEQLIKFVISEGFKHINFSIGEPLIHFTYISHLLDFITKESVDIRVSIQTNGNCNIKSVKQYLDQLESVAVNIYSVDEYFYKKYGNYKLESVTQFIKYIAGLKKPLQINLYLPAVNSEKQFLIDVNRSLNYLLRLEKDFLTNIIRFKPSYKVLDANVTPTGLLKIVSDQALSLGLQHVVTY